MIFILSQSWHYCIGLKKTGNKLIGTVKQLRLLPKLLSGKEQKAFMQKKKSQQPCFYRNQRPQKSKLWAQLSRISVPMSKYFFWSEKFFKKIQGGRDRITEFIWKLRNSFMSDRNRGRGLLQSFSWLQTDFV